MVRFLLFFPLLFFSACSSVNRGNQVCGAEEFILDSYKAREGKRGVCELLNIPFDELDPDLLLESKQEGEVVIFGDRGSSTVFVDGKTRLYDLLSKISLKDINLFKSYLLRDQKILPVDFSLLIDEADMSQNIALKKSDHIFFANSHSAIATLVLENGVQKEIFLGKGTLPLRKVLLETEKIPRMESSQIIEVVRAGMQNPKVYRFRWEHVAALPDESMLLIPSDVVYVSNGESILFKIFHLASLRRSD